MSAYVAADDVGALAEEMPDGFLLCREAGHPWRPLTAERVALDGGGQAYERVLRCPRCRSTRHQLISDTGALLTSGYRYADGYQLHGVGRIVGDARDALRLASITRGMEQAGAKRRNGSRKGRS